MAALCRLVEPLLPVPPIAENSQKADQAEIQKIGTLNTRHDSIRIIGQDNRSSGVSSKIGW